ncbi:MAG: undecaprenyl-diphosphate phosphatase [Dehalococcoidia bacterium]
MEALAAALVLGLVQGLTEFLPISSSGHLVLVERFLGYNPPGLALEAALHLATLGAVVVYYRGRLFHSLLQERAFWGQVGVALAVTAGIGLLLRSRLEAGFASIWVTGVGWLLTGVVLLATRVNMSLCGRKSAPGWWGAVLVGLAQGVALFPGVSRSGMTIAAAMWAGVAPKEAARFSFFLALPTILGATVLELGREVFSPRTLAAPWGEVAGASLVAGVSGWMAIFWLLRWLEKGHLWAFGVYCLLVGGVALALAYQGG